MGFLDALTVFDWITPTMAEVQDIASGPAAHFCMFEGAGWSGNQVKKLLKKKGIKTWGWMGLPGENGIMFTLNRRHAQYALSILEQKGIPLKFAPKAAYKEPRREKRRRRISIQQPRWYCSHCDGMNFDKSLRCANCGYQRTR